MRLIFLALAGCSSGGWADTASATYQDESYDDEDGDGYAPPVEGDTAASWATSDTAEPDACDDVLPDVTTLYMSADDSNSQASPVLARSTIDMGNIYYGRAYPWEFLNYYDFDYEPANTGEVRIDAQMVDSVDYPGDLELVVAIVAPRIEPAERPNLNIAFSLDVSGSMGGTGLAMEKATMEAIAHQLKAGDIVSIVSWNQDSATLLDGRSVSGPDDADVLDVIDSLKTGGTTDLSNGLNVAYAVAESYAAAGLSNRVVLISDGGANTGTTDETLIGAHAAQRADDAIYLVGVGATDPVYYSTPLMDRVTDLGRGAHIFVPESSEAYHQFDDERFIENFLVAATDVQLAMDLPAGWVIERFSGEEISTDPREVYPQNLASNDQMIYHLTLKNCAGEPNAMVHFAATWSTTAGESRETTLDASVDSMKASAGTQVEKVVALVDAARAIGGAWKAEPEVTLDDAIARVEAAPDDADLDEVLDYLRALRDLY